MKKNVIVMSALLIFCALLCVSCKKDSDAPEKSDTANNVVSNTGNNAAENTNNSDGNALDLLQEKITFDFLEEHGFDGFGNTVYDFDNDGELDLVSITYKDDYTDNPIKTILIQFADKAKNPITFTVTPDTAAYPFPTLTVVEKKDSCIIIENTGSHGGSDCLATANAYLFMNDEITALSPLHSELALKNNELEIEFTSKKNYQLTYVPTGDTFEGTVPSEHLKTEYFDKDNGVITGESAVLSINTKTSEIKMRIEVCIGGELCDFSYLDVTFKYSAKTHDYKPVKAEYSISDVDYSEIQTEYLND